MRIRRYEVMGYRCVSPVVPDLPWESRSQLSPRFHSSLVCIYRYRHPCVLHNSPNHQDLLCQPLPLGTYSVEKRQCHDPCLRSQPQSLAFTKHTEMRVHAHKHVQGTRTHAHTQHVLCFVTSICSQLSCLHINTYVFSLWAMFFFFHTCAHMHTQSYIHAYTCTRIYGHSHAFLCT